MHLGNLAHRRLERLARLVLDTAVLDKGRKVSAAIRTRLPAKVVDVRGELVRPRRLQLVAETLLDLGGKVLDAHAVDGVLDTRVLAVRAVTVVALGRENSLGDFETLVRRAEADNVGETRVGRLHRAARSGGGRVSGLCAERADMGPERDALRDAHTTTDGDVESE